MPGQLDRQALLARPAMGRVPGMRIAHDPLGLHRVQRLQIFGNLREHVETSRAVHLTDVGRHDDTPIPAQGDRALHVPANGQGRTRLLPGQRQFLRRAAATDADGPHAPADPAINRVVGRPHDRAIVLQESVGNPGQPPRRLAVIRQHRLAADVAGGRDHGAADGVEQQLVKRTVRQEDANLFKARGDCRGKVAVRPPSRQDDRTHRAGG